MDIIRMVRNWKICILNCHEFTSTQLAYLLGFGQNAREIIP